MISQLPGHIWDLVLIHGGPLALSFFVSADRRYIAASRIQRAKRRFILLRGYPPYVSNARVKIWRPVRSEWTSGTLIEWSAPGVTPMWIIRIDGTHICLQYIHVSESTIFIYQKPQGQKAPTSTPDITAIHK